jgi:hypothetical protein
VKELVRITSATTSTTLRKEAHMSDEFFQLVRSLVSPVEDRLTARQAMALPLFKGIDFDDADSLFPQNEPHADLVDVMSIVDVVRVQKGHLKKEPFKKEWVKDERSGARAVVG